MLKIMRERNYFAAMMVNEGEADGLVTGYTRSYSSVVFYSLLTGLLALL
jgi:malate dehydrogenase (oxaloacetate-decarboxylating)(NADP+)